MTFRCLVIYVCFTYPARTGKASVTNLSGEKLELEKGNSVSLYCLIEPFDGSRCHRWYVKRKSGAVEVNTILDFIGGPCEKNLMAMS